MACDLVTVYPGILPDDASSSVKGLLVEGLTEKEVVRHPPVCCVFLTSAYYCRLGLHQSGFTIPLINHLQNVLCVQAVFDAFEGDEYIKTEVTIELGSGEAASKQQAWVYVW